VSYRIDAFGFFSIHQAFMSLDPFGSFETNGASVSIEPHRF
jgi:hypothetical protein